MRRSSPFVMNVDSKRVAVFAVMGPLVGFGAFAAIPLLWSLLSSSPVDADDASKISQTTVLGLLLAGVYAVGLIPAILAALADACLAGKRQRRRWTIVTGFASSLLLALLLLGNRSPGTVMMVGLSGAIAAYICARLADRLRPLQHLTFE